MSIGIYITHRPEYQYINQSSSRVPKAFSLNRSQTKSLKVSRKNPKSEDNHETPAHEQSLTAETNV